MKGLCLDATEVNTQILSSNAVQFADFVNV